VATFGWSARQGGLTAASVTLAVLAGAALGLQDLWWAAISAWVVSNPDLSALWRKLGMRLVGTAVGLAFGYLIAEASAGRLLFQVLALFASAAVGSYLRFSDRYGYAWFYGALTIAIVIAVSVLSPDDVFSFAQFRLIEIALGVFASAFVHELGRAGRGPEAPAAAGPSRELTLVGIVAGLSVVAMTCLWSWFDTPSLPQALASTLVLADRDLAAIRSRARQRFIGCALGGVAGLAALSLEVDALPVFLVALFAGIFYFSRLHHGGGSQSYIGTQGGVAYISAMVTGNGPAADIWPVVSRLAGIFMGVALMVSVSFVLAAARERGAAPGRSVGAGGLE
jgi:uncharacterized membrane protein YccC